MEFALARERMVVEQLERRGIRDPRVLHALRKVPRHRFVDEALVGRAYGDYPLPIGEGQTISQPYMVALMTEALGLVGHERVLEIGTGSGYQTAVLAELCAKVLSIERIKGLADRAVGILDDLGYCNILVKVGDGTLGWRDEAPFDAILVTAGAPVIPDALIGQLDPKGRIVLPVGDANSQVLRKGVRKDTGMEWTELGDCVFVKLIGQQAWPNGG
ncbi:MAG TPA: protein-L-isoaspartate(D-aspartate) O-methyltransferase [Candidatus Methylomirabilis sp.]|nr:protein-L-isoaspartate(D-aspartate) O-methyltransferase [Candidatus Methylomirabilis sp.]